jgi:hypothetical protein
MRSGFVVVLVFTASAVEGQTNDHFFRSWRWATEPTAPRAAGMAGAMTAIADDGSGALWNPANLASLTKAEVQGGLLGYREGRSIAGDTFPTRTTVGFVAAARRLGSRWAVAAYRSEPYATRVRLSGFALPDQLTDEGSLDAVVTDFGVAAAWKVTEQLHVGARAAASRLAIDGEYSREPASGPTNLRVATAGRSTRMTGTLGFAYELGSHVRLGASVSSGAAWRVERTATSPVLGVVLDEGGPYEIRQPQMLSAGACFRTLKVLITAQVDRVRYGDIQSALVIAQGAHSRDEYRLLDAWEPRAAIEVSLPRKAMSLQLRAGVHRRSSGAFEYIGGDAVERAAFVGASRGVLVSAGASLVTARWLRFDVAVRTGGERSAWLAGMAVRF